MPFWRQYMKDLPSKWFLYNFPDALFRSSTYGSNFQGLTAKIAHIFWQPTDEQNFVYVHILGNYHIPMARDYSHFLAADGNFEESIQKEKDRLLQKLNSRNDIYEVVQSIQAAGTLDTATLRKLIIRRPIDTPEKYLDLLAEIHNNYTIDLWKNFHTVKEEQISCPIKNEKPNNS